MTEWLLNVHDILFLFVKYCIYMFVNVRAFRKCYYHFYFFLFLMFVNALIMYSENGIIFVLFLFFSIGQDPVVSINTLLIFFSIFVLPYFAMNKIFVKPFCVLSKSCY